MPMPVISAVRCPPTLITPIPCPSSHDAHAAMSPFSFAAVSKDPTLGNAVPASQGVEECCAAVATGGVLGEHLNGQRDAA